MAGLNERLIDENAVFFEAEANGASVVSGELRTGAGAQLGATKIVLRANEDITLADTKVMTLAVATADATGGTFVPTVSSTVTASGATVYSAGAIITEVILPRTAKEFAKVTVTTDETTPSGKFDVFCSSPLGFSNV